MSPRAAWRLESMGYRNVHDYVDGKLDCMAAGLPPKARTRGVRVRAKWRARDVPTCGLKGSVGDVRKVAQEAGFDAQWW